MSAPHGSGPGTRNWDPAETLQSKFNELTHHKLPHDFLKHRLARMGKSGFPKADDEDTKMAFAALARIMRTEVELGLEVIDYIAMRTALQQPFRKYLRETGSSDLAGRLELHRVRRSML